MDLVLIESQIFKMLKQKIYIHKHQINLIAFSYFTSP